MTRNLRVTRADGRLDVVISRPESRNALSLATLAEIAAVFRDHADDCSLRLAVITGEGDRAFAAGGDLKELASRRSAAEAEELFEAGHAALDAVRRFPLPVIAALNGAALGGGAELAVACDFRVAAASARFGFVQATLGLTTGFGGLGALQALVGPQRAFRMMLEARVLSAEEALAQGLVDRVAASGETLSDCVADFVAPFLGRSEVVVRALKEATLASEPSAATLAAEKAGFIRAWISAEHWAAADAVMARAREGRTT